MKILVRNLSRNTSEDVLRQQFETFGSVQSCQLVLDKKTGVSKGFGFVTMPKAGDAKAAMKHLNSSSLDGNTIRVKRAEEKPEDKPADKVEETNEVKIEEKPKQAPKKAPKNKREDKVEKPAAPAKSPWANSPFSK